MNLGVRKQDKMNLTSSTTLHFGTLSITLYTIKGQKY